MTTQYTWDIKINIINIIIDVDIVPHVLQATESRCILVGTVIKVMPLKPNVLIEFSKEVLFFLFILFIIWIVIILISLLFL